MGPQQRYEIASMGGKAAQALGVAHRWDKAEALLASAKGVAGKLKKRQARDV